MTDTNATVKVNIRIEGRNGNIFDGSVDTKGEARVTTTIEPRITNRANGMNGNEYPFEVPTCTSALAKAVADGNISAWGA